MAFELIVSDASGVNADAIVTVTCANPGIWDLAEKALYEAAGFEQLSAARQELGSIMRGEAAATPAFDLDAKYIIHVSGLLWVEEDQILLDWVRKCYTLMPLVSEITACSIPSPSLR